MEFRNLVHRRRTRALRSLMSPDSYLAEKGWFQGRPGLIGEPDDYHPWLPYPVVDLVVQRLPRSASILEWGSGYGSIFWRRRQLPYSRVTSVEEDPVWMAKVKKEARKVNVLLDVRQELLNGGTSDPRLYDFVIIDNKNRGFAWANTRNRIHPSTVVLVDDTHRPLEKELSIKIRSEIDANAIMIEGLGPWSHKTHASTLIYKSGANVLDL